MEMASLFIDTVDIERERKLLERDGFSWNSIHSMLQEKYRTHSRKGSFICKCCNKPVDLVLNQDRACFFRHKDVESCAGSENSKRYGSSRGGENQQKHHLGKSILREYFAGQLKIHNVAVQYGYFYKTRLKVVPDLILQFPDGAVWAVDYITGSKTDASYVRSLEKRMQAYEEEGFRSYFVVDQDWYSPHPNESVISLYQSEKVVMRTTEYDQPWQDTLVSVIEQFGLERVYPLPPFYTMEPYTIYSLLYVDLNQLKANLVRVVPVNHRYNRAEWGWLLQGPTSLPLEHVVSLNDKKTEFRWYGPDEQALREQLQDQSEVRYAEWLRVQAEQDEEEERKRQEQVRYSREQEVFLPAHHALTAPLNPRRDLGTLEPTKHPDPIWSSQAEKVDYFRKKLVLCRESELLVMYGVFSSDIEKCQGIIDEFDQQGYLEKNRSDSLYTVMNNMMVGLKVRE